MLSRSTVCSALLLACLAGGLEAREDVPLAVSIINREELEAGPARSGSVLMELAGKVPGVAITQVDVGLDKKSLRGLVVNRVDEGWQHDGRGTFTGPARDSVYISMGYLDRIQLDSRLKIKVKFSGGLFSDTIPVQQWSGFQPGRRLDSWDGLPDRVTPGEQIYFTTPPLSGPEAGLRWDSGSLNTRTRIQMFDTGNYGDARRALDAGIRMKYDRQSGRLDFDYDYQYEDGRESGAMRVPDNFDARRGCTMRAFDPWGVELYNYDWKPQVSAPMTPTHTVIPSIDQVSPWVLPGGNACACGTFPSPEAWEGVQLGGRSLPIISGSSSLIEFTLPADFSVGQHDWGFSADYSENAEEAPNPTDGKASNVLGVSGTIDQDKLWRGESTPVTFFVTGTDRPFPMRIENHTPGIITMAGGNSQFKLTSGGAENKISDQVTGIKVGDFSITYSINTGDCPCAPTNDDEVKTVDREFGEMLDVLLGEGPPPGGRTSTVRGVTDSLDLGGDRFKVDVDWRTPLDRLEVSGTYNDLSDAELFFFDADNLELVVKVFDACGPFDHLWVMAAGATNVDYDLTVTDTQSGVTKTYSSPTASPFRPILDTDAFSTCP